MIYNVLWITQTSISFLTYRIVSYSTMSRSRRQSLERIHTSTPAPESAIDRSVPDSGPARIDEEKSYFESNPEPPYLSEIQQQVNEFIKFHSGKRRIALVTVGCCL